MNNEVDETNNDNGGKAAKKWVRFNDKTADPEVVIEDPHSGCE